MYSVCVRSYLRAALLALRARTAVELPVLAGAFLEARGAAVTPVLRVVLPLGATFAGL